MNTLISEVFLFQRFKHIKANKVEGQPVFRQEAEKNLAYIVSRNQQIDHAAK